MFKSALVLASLAASAFGSQAHAEVYTCVFTEPFIAFQYDSSTETMVTSGLDDVLMDPNGKETPQTTTGVLYRPRSTGEITLINSKGVILFTLEETGKGSDGMSDSLYPFDVTANSSQFLPPDYKGGCYTPSKPKVEPVQ